MLKLTKVEADILRHRLEVPDALADVFEGLYQRADVEDVADLLLAGDYDGALAFSEGITHAVLADAVEGSTYYGAALGAEEGGEISRQKLDSILRAGQSLARKVGQVVGRRLTFPNY